MSVSVKKKGYHVTVEPINEWIPPLRKPRPFDSIQQAQRAVSAELASYDRIWGIDKYLFQEHGRKSFVRVVQESSDVIWKNRLFLTLGMIGLSLAGILIAVFSVLAIFADDRPVWLAQTIIGILVVTAITGGIVASVAAFKYVRKEMKRQRERLYGS